MAISSVAAGPDMVPTNSTSGLALTSSTPSPGIWRGEVGDGFRSTIQTLNLEAGGTAGVEIFGGVQRHDLALASLSYGRMYGEATGEDHWYHGNWEIRGELFGGTQFSPTGNWLIGAAPHLRYNFATGTRWIPYADAGAGVAATGIRAPDLGGTFEFNTQGNVGVHWFVRDNVALTCEAGLLHVSSAGIYRPNQGVNCVKGMAGVTWFF